MHDCRTYVMCMQGRNWQLQAVQYNRAFEQAESHRQACFLAGYPRYASRLGGLWSAVHCVLSSCHHWPRRCCCFVFQFCQVVLQAILFSFGGLLRPWLLFHGSSYSCNHRCARAYLNRQHRLVVDRSALLCKASCESDFASNERLWRVHFGKVNFGRSKKRAMCCMCHFWIKRPHLV